MTGPSAAAGGGREGGAHGAHELEERYRSVIETATDGIIVIGPDGRIDSVNPAVERLFGYAMEELIGRNVSVLMPEPYRSRHDAYIARFLATGRSRIIGVGREVVGRRRDGSTFPMRLSVGEMIVGGRHMFTGIVHDLGGRRHLEAELARVEAKLGALAQEAALRRVAVAVARQVPTDALMDLVADEVRRLLDVEAGLVLSGRGPDAVVRGSAGAAAGHPPSARASSALGLMPDGRGGARLVSLELHPDAAVREWADRTGLRTAVIAAVSVSGRAWGAIVAGTAAHRIARRDAVGLLADFAELVSLAISNAETHHELRRRARTDHLTGLLNHGTFHEEVARRFDGSRALRRPMTLALLDVDWFKSINDTFGHPAGDRVLAAIAGALTRAARRGDTLGRVGGEEFGWLMPDTGAADGLRAVRRFADRVAALRVEPVRAPLGVSGGVACASDAASPADLVRRADRALYWAKGHGRGRCELYEAGMDGPSRRPDRAETRVKGDK